MALARGFLGTATRQRAPTARLDRQSRKFLWVWPMALGGAILFLFPFPRGAVLPQTFGKEKGEAWGVAPRLSFFLGWFSCALAVWPRPLLSSRSWCGGSPGPFRRARGLQASRGSSVLQPYRGPLSPAC